MNFDWQSWTSLLIVGATAAIFAVRLVRRKKTGCAGGCDCHSRTLGKH
jgi:hypothetical protein